MTILVIGQQNSGGSMMGKGSSVLGLVAGFESHGTACTGS